MRFLALLVLAFVGVWPLPAAAQSIKLGAVVPLTGRYGSGGAQVRAGYEIAVEHVNAAGGVTVGGKKMPLELVLLDDESDATKTVSRLETLAAQGVVVYLGGFGSDLHAAASSVAEKNRVPYLGVAFALNKVHQQGFRYLFSPFWKSPDIGRELPGLLASLPADSWTIRSPTLWANVNLPRTSPIEPPESAPSARTGGCTGAWMPMGCHFRNSVRTIGRLNCPTR